jgi:hypothetical protein
VDPNEMQRQMLGEQYSQDMNDVFNKQRQTYSDRQMSVVIADINEQENEAQTPVSMAIGNDDKQIRYNPMCSY